MKKQLTLPLRVLTHNIRYATTSPFPGEEPWPSRLPLLLNELRFASRYIPQSILCLQEVLHTQLLDILTGLNTQPSTTYNSHEKSTEKEWTSIGVAREDGLKKGEYSPIIYQPSIWILLSSSTRWLSPTPSKPSKGWDAASERIVTTAVLKHRETGQVVIVMNTHLDDQGSRARKEAAKLLLVFKQEVRKPWKEGVVVLAGDFNSTVEGGAYRVICEEMDDLCHLVREEERYGERDTFTGFEGKERDRQRIDFLFIESDGGERWEVDGYGVLENVFDGGVFVSDHRAVVGDLRLKCVSSSSISSGS